VPAWCRAVAPERDDVLDLAEAEAKAARLRNEAE
jgi:hypothetical protein